jgi:hypothetical protein
VGLRTPGGCERVAGVKNPLARDAFAFRSGRNLVLAAALAAATLGSAGCSKKESPKPETASLQPSEAAKPAKKPKKKKPPAPKWPEAVPGTLMLDPQRPLAEGSTVAGWEPKNVDGRVVAQLSQPKATVQFDLAPVPGDYVLTGVARVTGTKSAKLTPTLNGKVLPAWTVTDEWAMYTSKVPKDLLAAAKDELALAAGTEKAPVAIELDSVALRPLSDRATIEMGAPLGGHLIDGFYKVEGGKVRWSRGKKSVLGVVLAPSKSPYIVEIQGSGFPGLSPIGVAVTINGKAAGTVSFDKKFGKGTLEVPAGVFTSGLNRIELTYDKSGQPKEFGKSKDDRDIAVRIQRVSIEPQS